MMRIAYGTLLLALVGTGAFAADIYRSTAPDGTVSYSDRPQGENSEFVYSATPRVARTAPGTAPTAPGASAANAPVRPDASQVPTVTDGPSAAALREERQKNCDIAREILDRYTLSRRLFHTNADGQREYLDDAAVAEARAKAAADVQDWCG